MGIEQLVRLFNCRLYSEDLQLDSSGRIRVDVWEINSDVQQAVADIWPNITTETLRAQSDYAGYQKNFLNLFGFELPGVDYDEDIEVELDLPSAG